MALIFCEYDMTTIVNTLTPYRPDFPEAFAALDEWQRDAAVRRTRWTLVQTPLSISVMGQIKAGNEFDVICINGDHNIPAVLTLRQIESEFLEHMFSVEDSDD
jgi:hypothetical protein